MTNEEREALRKLLDFMEDEKDDFEASTADGDAAEGHIYHDMQVLEAYLQRTEKTGLTTHQKEMLVVFGALALLFLVATIFVLSGGLDLLKQ